ncbi:hypothetical protein [uncultured Lutibacter sp.]|uniref:hypothetical protein n=1 Tax=uncultured Lutibacter sp. TaxID=437739 RepID=UPI002613D3AE|nr:hypothetical protein [uncultured Lutibacter sp.]
MRKIILILFFFGGLFLGHSQKFDTMSDADKENFKIKAIEKIKLLGFTFDKIATSRNIEDKNRIIESILPSFVLKPEQATIEVASRKGKNDYPIETYLREKLKNYKKRYAVVDIDFVSFDIKDLRPHRTEPNSYYMEYTIVQKFCGSKLGNRNKEGLLQYDYCDYTTKKGSFLIKKVNTILGSKWKMLYESIYVVDIKIL